MSLLKKTTKAIKMKYIDLASLEGVMNYAQYRGQMEDISSDGLDNALGYGQALLEYNILNIRRMNRWDKTLRLDDVLQELKLNSTLHLLVLTEGWCGDAAHVNPVLNRLSEGYEHLELHFINRDQHLDVMDAFLTNGGRSIPKAILLSEDHSVLGAWGPRPSELQSIFLQERKNPTMTVEEMKLFVQKWYNKDKGKTIAKEVIDWINASI